MFSPPLKKSIVFLKYALKMDLVKGEWFDLYDIAKIAKDLRDTHEKDSDTGDPITPVEDMLGTFEELKKTDNATQAQMIMYSKLFKINFTKMDPYEFKTFTDILQRYSDLCKPVRGNGRGRKKK